MTGAMGSGKSTVLKLLQSYGLNTIEEPARQILAEERSIEDDGVPERDPKYFSQLMLSRAIYQFNHPEKVVGNIIYDRGIPDIVAYFQLFNLSYPPALKAAKLFRYEPRVFVFPAWEEIYSTDEERKMSFEEALNFGDEVEAIYRDLGYHLIQVPQIPAKKRAQFILDEINR